MASPFDPTADVDVNDAYDAYPTVDLPADLDSASGLQAILSALEAKLCEIDAESPMVLPPRPLMPLTMGSLRTGNEENTNEGRAFNLLHCIVFMTVFDRTREGRLPILRAYPDKPELIEQIGRYVDDPANGVVHDRAERTVFVRRKNLYGLVREQLRIQSCWFPPGGKRRDVPAGIRKSFSKLADKWRIIDKEKEKEKEKSADFKRSKRKKGDEAHFDTFRYFPARTIPRKKHAKDDEKCGFTFAY